MHRKQLLFNHGLTLFLLFPPPYRDADGPRPGHPGRTSHSGPQKACRRHLPALRQRQARPVGHLRVWVGHSLRRAASMAGRSLGTCGGSNPLDPTDIHPICGISPRFPPQNTENFHKFPQFSLIISSKLKKKKKKN